MEEIKTDLAIIGAGPGGYVAAIRAGQLGIKTTLIERKYIGGVCLNVGCIPTKALLHASELFSSLKKSKEMGIEVSDLKFNLENLNAWKKKVVNKLTSGISFLLKNYNINVILGHAEFIDKNSLLVKTSSGNIKIESKNIIIATGSRPMDLINIKRDGDFIWNSDDAVEMKEIPKKLLVIGAGAVGLEFASIYSRLGSEVVVIEIAPNILPGSDKECANILKRALEKQGIKIFTNSKVISYKDKKFEIEIEGKVQVFEFDKVLLAVGRKPNTDSLGLERINIKLDDKGFIVVNNKLQTNIENIYAIGDVKGQPLLAHKASREGIVAVEIIASIEKEYDVRYIPNVVYTMPEFASVGLSEEEAVKSGYKIKVGKFPISANGRALTMNITDGIAKLVVNKDNGEILGVHIVSPEASSLISEATLGMESCLSYEDIALTVHPHPSISEILMEASDNVDKKAIHIVN
ncbi:MAG: dihydrolipoyl dehydrogenase [candidate division WOR-3 bacterium]|nr:dihydrolipoyl dehydrogenase [candidate division WOR-3 bacterium]MCX7947932.1 dihydrolipoyl dehydrogenase [candidate division WOR-3 bacterium]MDW8150876.1 dihydrolipoyl dehydrogenase [candidate division WOR-3 bacterium]